MNPPYDKDLHLQFFSKSLDILSPTGSMCIVEPATWLINIRKNGKAHSIYEPLKNRIEGHVKSVLIENYNKEFNTGIYTPFSITAIDYSTNYTTIDYECFGEKKTVKSIYDCNLVGNYDLVWSIISKIRNYKDVMKNHVSKENKKNTWYCKYAKLPASGALMLGDRYNNDGRWRKILNGEYQLAYLNSIYYAEPGYVPTEFIPKKKDHGGNLTDKDAECVSGTKTEINNWRYYIFNNSLPLFISILMTIDQNNNSLEYIPWLVDKKYTDKEIYNKLGFTEEEINLIETTIKKYERHSLWFKRYMCGQSSVSDKEVEEYIDNL